MCDKMSWGRIRLTKTGGKILPDGGVGWGRSRSAEEFGRSLEEVRLVQLAAHTGCRRRVVED